MAAFVAGGKEVSVDMASVQIVLQKGNQVTRLEGTRIRFSAHQCLALDGGAADMRCLRLLTDHLAALPGLGVAVDSDGPLLKYILQHFPSLRERVRWVIVEKVPADGRTELEGLPVVLAEEIPSEVQTVFLCATRTYPRLRMRKWLGGQVRLVDLDLLPALALEHLPARAWVPWARDIIYPVDLPEIDFQLGRDVILIDCPARNLSLMPNGLGYVHNALKQVQVQYQTCDLDILIYHRFHLRRLGDEGGQIYLPSGRQLPADPWQAEHYDLWSDPEVIAYFEPDIQEIVAKLVAARPKVLGLSVHTCNEKFSATVVERVKAALPEVIILVGGFACYSPDIGLRAFPLADYMCIGEGDLTVGPLVERLARGERPANTPGVLSRFDRPEVPFLPAPMVHDLDLLEPPRYQWYDLSIYRNYNGYQLTPVIASRGCRWSRCTFCAERFYWRIRSPKSFVEELAWLVDQGCRLFMFNESDLNGRPETLLAICDEIIQRGLQIKLTGQLRIQRQCGQAYYRKLRQAGFVALRFGVDAFSANTLRLQKKGYTTAAVSQNLKDCTEAGISTEVNWVIGVPGETEQDIEEGIELILKNKPYIGRLANINPLILSTGSVYWSEPEKHHIHFRGAKEELYREHARAIPAHLWYSTDPYIDEKVRKRRFERIVLALHQSGFGVGAWANRVIEDVKHNRDSVRTGPGEEAATCGDDGRSPDSVFPAKSAWPNDKVPSFQTDLYVVSSSGELLGIEAPVFASAFAKVAGDSNQSGGRTVDLRRQCRVRFVRTKAAVPELIQSFGAYNIVLYDGLYYGLPQNPDPIWYRLIDQQLRENAFVPPGSPSQRGRWVRGVALGKWGYRKAKALAKRILIWLGLRRPAPPPPPCQVPWGEVNVACLPGVVTGSNLDQVLAEVAKVQGMSPRVRAPLTLASKQGVDAAALTP